MKYYNLARYNEQKKIIIIINIYIYIQTIYTVYPSLPPKKHKNMCLINRQKDSKTSCSVKKTPLRLENLMKSDLWLPSIFGFSRVVGVFPGGEPQRSEQKVDGTDCKKVYGKVLMGKYLKNTCPL